MFRLFKDRSHIIIEMEVVIEVEVVVIFNFTRIYSRMSNVFNAYTELLVWLMLITIYGKLLVWLMLITIYGKLIVRLKLIIIFNKIKHRLPLRLGVDTQSQVYLALHNLLKFSIICLNIIE